MTTFRTAAWRRTAVGVAMVGALVGGWGVAASWHHDRVATHLRELPVLPAPSPTPAPVPTAYALPTASASIPTTGDLPAEVATAESQALDAAVTHTEMRNGLASDLERFATGFASRTGRQAILVVPVTGAFVSADSTDKTDGWVVWTSNGSEATTSPVQGSAEAGQALAAQWKKDNHTPDAVVLVWSPDRS